jgi:hypothetical protein
MQLGRGCSYGGRTLEISGILGGERVRQMSAGKPRRIWIPGRQPSSTHNSTHNEEPGYAPTLFKLSAGVAHKIALLGGL